MASDAAFITLGISLGLGLLVGLQRERAQSSIAGIRTFALITLAGTLSAMVGKSLGGWIVAAGMAGLGATLVVAGLASNRKKDDSPGVTTEVAALIMYLVGAYLVDGEVEIAMVITGAVAVLLYAKPMLHGLVQRIGDADLRAIMQFVLIALVILPVLPNQPYGPFDALNPREIWWIVVLVMGISFVGYIALKMLGPAVGPVVAGLLGGLVSSTATTVSSARRAASSDAHLSAATLMIILASTIVYGRVLVEVAAVARPALPLVAGPVGVLLVVSSIMSLIVWLFLRRAHAPPSQVSNPAELKGALAFGALYAVVTVAIAAARRHLDQAGMYVVAGISGLTDMDAITLSTSRMVVNDGLDASIAWRAIVIASMANLLFKLMIVAALGGRRLILRLWWLIAIQIVVGGALLVFWPDEPWPRLPAEVSLPVR